MRNLRFYLPLALLTCIISCTNDLLPETPGKTGTSVPEENAEPEPETPGDENFSYLGTIQVGGEGASEISAFDPLTNKLFVVNVAMNEISVFDISDLYAPLQLPSIDVSALGTPNSVDVHDGLLAVAVEAPVKQDPGHLAFYDTDSQSLSACHKVGSLPDMVKFSPDGRYAVSADEGEPNADYTIDPPGTISIVEVAAGIVTTVSFDNYVCNIPLLQEGGFRLFGPGATLATDVEPEYVAISEDSRLAWVTLQENNGIAKVDLQSKTIIDIYPLGFKDYSLPGNEIDPSDEDGVKALASYPVFGVYMPDGIIYLERDGTGYLITANEGDAREYPGTPGFAEEERIKDVVLDPTVFPNAANLQQDEVLGRLKITNTLGDPDMDGTFSGLYSFGARSFSIYTVDGILAYDSGNDIAAQTLALTPDAFNGDDGRSDDKGAEPESVEVLKSGDRYFLFVGLERNSQVMVYDITMPLAPVFLDILFHDGDEAPEGLLAIPAAISPNGKDLLVVSNEVSGTVTFYSR